jgi:hypothetical protein
MRNAIGSYRLSDVFTVLDSLVVAQHFKTNSYRNCVLIFVTNQTFGLTIQKKLHYVTKSITKIEEKIT